MYFALLAGYVGSKCNAFGLNSGDARIKFWLGHQLSWQIFLTLKTFIYRGYKWNENVSNKNV
jgi:hypothetical protein